MLHLSGKYYCESSNIDMSFEANDLCSICRKSVHLEPCIRIRLRDQIWCLSCASLSCPVRANFPTRGRLISCTQATVCSSTAGKRIAIRLPTISGLSSGVTSMHRPFPAVYEKYKERGGRPVFHPEDIAPFVSLLTDLYNLAATSDYIRDMRIKADFSQCSVKWKESPSVLGRNFTGDGCLCRG